MVAAGSQPARPRRRSAAREMAAWAVVLAVHAAAICVAWWVADRLVPLPPRLPAGESVEAWTAEFNAFFRTFFVVYVAAGLALLYLLGRTMGKRLSTLIGDSIRRGNSDPARGD